MKSFILALAFVPALASAFTPIDVPSCRAVRKSPASTTDQKAACRMREIMAMSYNDQRGVMPKAIEECAGIVGHVMADAHPAHDNEIILCTLQANLMGMMPN